MNYKLCFEEKANSGELAAKEADLALFFVDILEKGYEKYSERYHKCLKKQTEKNVHQLRVSIRRLQAKVQLINSLHKTAYSGQLIRMLKDNLKAFGTLRDLQVMLEHLGEIRHQAHELNYFYHYLLKKEEKLIKSAIAKLDDIDLSEFESVLFFIKNNIRHNAASVDFSINRLIEVIDESFNKVMNRVSQVDYNKTTTIHKVRIAFKKFRYMIESAAPLIGLGKQQLKELSEFQSLLGAIQDSEVYTAELTDFITIQEEIPKKAFTDSLRLAEEHKNLVLNRYRANAGKLTKFWH